MSVLDLRQLEAGGFVGPKSKADAQGTEEVVARRYGCAALGDRVVVQLGADRLGPAIDLAMEYLGLEPKGTSKPIARQRRQALGFANWALTNHSEHAKFALSLVKRIKSSARRAAAKPGHAWDEFAVMADELNKSVRHFLPSFWDEVARIFKDCGNATYAGRSLNKALEAARVHAVDVDREYRRDAVLEFTLSGCLTAKVLGDYTQDLAKQFEPAEAYSTLRDLVVRRTLGGMAPTASMGTDLVKFAKAAELDPEAEMEGILKEIIVAPAMSRAPLQFWKSVRKQVEKLVAESPSFAVWLLVHTDAKPSWRGESPVWQWVDYLETVGALPYLWSETLPPEPAIPGGRAGWIGRAESVEVAPNKRIFDLLEKVTETLKRDGTPVSIVKTIWNSFTIDVDVLEACLQLEIPLAPFPPNARLDFTGWLQSSVDHPRRNSSLERICADPHLAQKVREKMPELVEFRGEVNTHSYGRQVPRRSFEAAAENHPAVHVAWWSYLDEQLVRLEMGGLVDAEVAHATLRKAVSVTTAERFPELKQRLAKIDLVDNLCRTLRAGVIDEYGWPTLDAAFAQQNMSTPPSSSPPTPGTQLRFWMFPVFSYYEPGSLTVVRGLEFKRHDLILAKNQHLILAIPVGDDALILIRDDSYQTEAFWLSDPQSRFKYAGYFYHYHVAALLDRDGGSFLGQRTLRPGNQFIPETRKYFHDGDRIWSVKPPSQPYDPAAPTQLAEVDPESGKFLRDSIPPWFERDLPSGANIDWTSSSMLTLPHGAESSPLGTDAGLIGWKLIRRRDGSVEGVGIDGRRHVTREDDPAHLRQLHPVALIDQPCGQSRWVVTANNFVFDEASRVGIADIHGERTTYAAGQPIKFPVEFFHFLQVRHSASSKRLRSVTEVQAKSVFEAAIVEHQALRKGADETCPERDACARAVASLLPDAPEALVQGIRRIARLAAEEQISLDKLRALLDSSPGTSTASVDEGTAIKITAGIDQLWSPNVFDGYYQYSRNTTDVQKQIREIADFFRNGNTAEFTKCLKPWFHILPSLSTHLWRAFWKSVTGEDGGESIALRIQQPWFDTAKYLLECGFFEWSNKLRIHVAKIESTSPLAKKGGELSYGWSQGANRYVANHFVTYNAEHVQILEYSPDGAFQIPANFPISQSDDVDLGWERSQVAAFLDAAAKLTSIPFVSKDHLNAASERLGISPVEVGVVWMGNLRTVIYGNDKLTKEIRDEYGWKAKQVQESIAALNATPVSNEFLFEAIRNDPAGAIGSARDVVFDAMVDAWAGTRTIGLRIPPELIGVYEKSGHKYYRRSDEIIALYGDREKSPHFIKRSFEFALGKDAYYKFGPHFSPEWKKPLHEILDRVAFSIRLFQYVTPFGDPVRRVIPELVEALGKWLNEESTIIPLAPDYDYQSAEKVQAKYERLLKKFTPGDDGLARCDTGLVVAAGMGGHYHAAFRPARMKNQQDFEQLLALASPNEHIIGQIKAAWAFRNEEMMRLGEINRGNDCDEGTWEQDPRRSAQSTVAAVQKKLKLDEPSAVYYLQLLTLPDPSNANIGKWNGWSTKQIKAAAKPLVEQALLVEAKRARAGRDVFLPGGWESLAAPNLPVESWKLPLFGIGKGELPQYRLQQIVPTVPVGELFVAAWNRIQKGDVPRYEDK